MSMFVLVRRPRQPLTWTFVGVMAGLIAFYLADVVLYQPGISVQAGLIWQFIHHQGASITVLSALVLNYLLRDRRLKTWEWAVVGFIVVRMAIDVPWLATHMWTGLGNTCLTTHGLPRLTCPPEDRLAIATGMLSGACVAALFVSTTLTAVEPKRHILRRYMVWVVLLIVGGSLALQFLTLAGYNSLGVIPGEPATWLAILIGIRMLLALEEEETGVRFPLHGWRILVWLVVLIGAVALDLSWGWPGAPVWTVVVLTAGVAGAGAIFINSLVHHTTAVANAAEMPLSPLPVDPAPATATLPAPQPLRIYLFGPMRVVRDGETLPNTAEVWRSTKTRSLLAYLALCRAAGATQTEIIDALWPSHPDADAQAERASFSAFRSYLSTLRRVLDPDGPRGSNRWVVRAGERYALRIDHVWVDVWEFEALASQAEALLKQGQTEAGLACWRRAVRLYAPGGLLPDELHLPAPAVEPLREHLRQRWLGGLRRLARSEEEAGRAVELWETIHQAEPLDEEATAWLLAHYRRLHNASGLRIVEQRLRNAEAELGT